MGGSFPIHASDDAPVFVVTSGQAQRTTYHRTFSPWTANTSLEVALGGGVSLSATGEVGRTAFYEWAAADLHLTYRFLPGPSRRTGAP